MIIVIVIKERSERSGTIEEVVSHGIDMDTNEIITLPSVSPQNLGAIFDMSIGEYVLKDKNDF